MSELSEYDKALLEKVTQEMETRNKRFFEAHGLGPLEVQAAKFAYKAFLEDHRLIEKQIGKTFMHSPMAMKAFVMGYVYGRKP